ncbi:ribosome maturation factor RimP [Arthrobacter sp. 35W]|uniref:ribosome maturation factor RimP n=1 Tax=Arthrobacter sp. 35W TaxID=1132441 RepID=UPI00040ACF92|nr:ribosome maturation factor RimP [Arthrobacter sp. 35W]
MNKPERPNGSAEHAAKTAHSAEAQRLFELINPTVEANRLFLEDVSVTVAGSHRTVAVVIDLPDTETGGVGLDVIGSISRELSDVLDNDPRDDGRPYDLEVSSPGISRPLTEPRHWRRSLGRMVKVNVMAGENLTGRVLEVGDDGVLLRPELEVKKGMKPKQGEPVRIGFETIRRGVVEVEFSHLDDVELDLEFGPAGAGAEGEES